MKITKIISSIMLILFLMSISVFSVFAANPDYYDYKVDDVYFSDNVKNDGTWFYELSKYTKEITIIGYRGDEKNIVIPEEIDGYPVTSIFVCGYGYYWGGFDDFPIFENNIESITIPKTITQILGEIPPSFSPEYHKCSDTDGHVYFKGNFRSALTNLKEFIVDDENKYFSSEDGVLFNKDKTVLLSYPIKKADKEYTVPNAVKYILDCAFYRVDGNKTLKKLTITENVERMGWLASNERDYCLDTIEIRNVKITEEALKSKLWGNKEIIVYEDSNAHRYYKNAIPKKNYENLPKLTVVDNPYVKKEETKSEEKKEETKSEKKKEDKLSPQTGDNITTVAVFLSVASLAVLILGVSKKRINTR